MTKVLPAVVAGWAILSIALAVIGAVVYQQYFAGVDGPKANATAATAIAGGALSIRRAEQPRPMPELRFVDGDAKPRSLAEFRGRMVLLNVWATWCVPCRKEMLALDRLQATLGGPQFEVVALSIDVDGVSKVKGYYEELGLKALRTYVDTDGSVTAKLRAVGIPLTLLVDRRGNELWRSVGPAEWDQPAVVELIRKEVGAPMR